MHAEHADDEGPVYLPTSADPAIIQFFEDALPCCECEGDERHLWPIRSVEREGVFAVICNCGYIGGDGSSVADAITTRNAEARAQCHR